MGAGAHQGSCRLSHALLRFSVEGSRATLIAASRSGFKVTTAIGDPLRSVPTSDGSVAPWPPGPGQDGQPGWLCLLRDGVAPDSYNGCHYGHGHGCRLARRATSVQRRAPDSVQPRDPHSPVSGTPGGIGRCERATPRRHGRRRRAAKRNWGSRRPLGAKPARQGRPLPADQGRQTSGRETRRRRLRNQ